MKRLWFFSWCMILSVALFAQTRAIDSLRTLTLSVTDAGKKKEYIVKLLSLHRSMNSDTLLHYTKYLKLLSQNDVSASLTADIYLALYLSKNAQLDSALKIVKHGVAQTKKPSSLHTQFHYLHSVIQLKKNDQKEALNGFFNVLQMAEQNRDTNFIIRCLNGIGWVYLEMNQPQEALPWLHNALNVTTNKKYEHLYDVVFLNMAPCYGMLYNLDSVDYCLNQSLSLAKKYEDLQTMANGFALQTNIALHHNDMAQAIELMKKAIAIRRTLNDPFYIVSDMAALASIYASMHQPQKGIAVAKEAIALAHKHGLQAKMPFIYSGLAANYKVAGDYKNLALTLEQSLELKDTLYQKAKAEELAEMQTKYETEKKETAIRLLKKENELKDLRNRKAIYTASAVVLLLIITSTFFYIHSKTQEKRRLAEERAMMERSRLHAIIHTQEKERQRISAELHDGIGPVLSAVKLNLSQVAYDKADTNKYETAMQLIDESYKGLRQISHQMMPAVLSRNGLTAATEELAANVNNAGLLTITVDGDAINMRFDPSLEVHLYRIVQELLNNIVKYAAATEAQIQILHEKNEIKLMIEDNGKGFDKRVLETSKGNGWNNIISRLSALNGSIEIDSQPSRKGTVVFITTPTKQESKTSNGTSYL